MIALAPSFFKSTATPEIYTLSLHDALPISQQTGHSADVERHERQHQRGGARERGRDRKSTRLNSSHANISYAVFCLKKKKTRRMSSRTTQPSVQTRQARHRRHRRPAATTRA